MTQSTGEELQLLEHYPLRITGIAELGAVPNFLVHLAA